MVQLKYVGVNAVGRVVSKGFALDVVRGEVYDIPEQVVPKLLANGEWEDLSSRPFGTTVEKPVADEGDEFSKIVKTKKYNTRTYND